MRDHEKAMKYIRSSVVSGLHETSELGNLAACYLDLDTKAKEHREQWRLQENDLNFARTQIEVLKDQIAMLQRRLHEIAEEYAGMEGFEPIYASEAYLMRVIKKMYDLTQPT